MGLLTAHTRIKKTLGLISFDFIPHVQTYIEEKTLLPFTWFVRLGFLALLAMRPLLPSIYYPPEHQQAWWPAIVAYGVYLFVLGRYAWHQVPVFSSLQSKETQIVADIVFAGAFFFLNGDHESNLALAMLLPLLIAGRYFDASMVLKVFLLALGVLLVALLGMLLLRGIPLFNTITPRVFLVRALLFGCIVGPLARSEFLKRQMNEQRREYRRRLGVLVEQVELAQRQDIASLVQAATEIARKELRAETVSFFLYQQGRFHRKKSAGIEDDWLSDESYAPGEGITGQVAIGQHGTNFGQPTLDNQAERNPRVVRDFLERYRAKLRSGKLVHLIAVPVNGSNRTFGILRAVNKLTPSGEIDSDGFSWDDQVMLESIAALVGFAHRAERHTRNMQAVFDINATLLQASGEMQVCQNIAAAVAGLGYPVCCVLLRDSDDTLTVRALHGLSNEDASSLPSLDLPHDEQIEILRTGKTSMMVDLQTGRRPAIAEWTRAHNLSSVLRLPLSQQGRVIGVIEIYSMVTYSFYREEIHTLEIFAAQATLAIMNARLIEQNLDQFNRRKELAEIISSIIALDDQMALFEMVAHRAAALLQAEDCSVFWVNRERNTLDLKASHSIPTYLFVRNVTQIRAAPHVGLPAYVAATGQPLCFTGEAYKEHHAWDGTFVDHLAYLPSKRCSSLLVYPITDQRKNVVGVIKVENKQGAERREGFSRADHELLDLLAMQISIAVDKIQQIQKLRHLRSSAQTITEMGEQREMLLRIAESACKVVQADLAVICPYDAERQELLVDQSATYGQNTMARLTTKPRHSGLTRDALRSRDGYIVIEDIEADPKNISDFTQQEQVRSFIAVALKARKTPVGILYCDFRQPRRFSLETIRTTQAFGDLAAIAISNANLFAHVNHTVQELSAVQQLTEAALTDVDLDSVLGTVVGIICDTLGYEMCTVSLVNETERMIETLAAKGISEEWKRMARHSLDSNDIQADIVRTGATAVIDGWDDRIDLVMYERFDHARLVRIFTPIRGRHGVIGTVEAGHDRERHPCITPEEVKILQRCLEQVALVIESARLLAQTRRHAEQLETLHAMSQQIDRALSLSQEGILDVLQLAANTAAMVIGPGASAAIHIYDRQRDSMTLAAWSGDDRTRLENNPVFALGEHRRAVASAAPRIMPGQHAPELGIPSACIPLKVEREVLGTLCVIYQRDHWFTMDERKILEICADQLAIAISIAKANQQIQQLDGLSDRIVQIYRSEVGQTLAIGGDTLSNLLEVNQRLSRRLDGLSDEIGRFYHLGIGQPLAIASDTLANLLDPREILGPLTPLQTDRLRTAMQELTTLKQQIKRLLIIRRIEEERLNISKSTVDLRVLIEDAIAKTRGKANEAGILLACDIGALNCALQIDAEKIQEAIVDLLLNAIKFSSPGGKVTINGQEQERSVQISVRDNGRGIAPEDLARIFEKYFQAPPLLSNQQSGAGLGLYLARKFVNMHGGEIAVESAPRQGSLFTITLPKS